MRTVVPGLLGVMVLACSGEPVQPGRDAGLGPDVPRIALCGDGILDPGETCDDGNATNGDGCSSQCQVECFDWCGDASLPPLDASGWDAGASGYCGDGILDVANDEQCDNGEMNGKPGSSCLENCILWLP